jgi:putative SOS response-associated peptidase YedK
MCGRFTASFEFGEIKLLFNLQRDIPLLSPRYNIAPSQEVPVIVQNEGINELKPMKWGLVPSWSPDPSIGDHMINARAETITEKPSYRRLVESKRCLIPADGFYEWRREGNRKVPVWCLGQTLTSQGFSHQCSFPAARRGTLRRAPSQKRL